MVVHVFKHHRCLSLFLYHFWMTEPSNTFNKVPPGVTHDKAKANGVKSLLQFVVLAHINTLYLEVLLVSVISETSLHRETFQMFHESSKSGVSFIQNQVKKIFLVWLYHGNFVFQHYFGASTVVCYHSLLTKL